MKKFNTIVTIFIVSAIMLGCSKDGSDSTSETKENPPVGYWQVNGNEYYFISSNGTYTAAWWYGQTYLGNIKQKVFNNSEGGMWSLDATGATLSFEHGGRSTVYVVQSMGENMMVLLNMDDGSTSTFKKVANNASKLKGKWKVTRWACKVATSGAAGDGESGVAEGEFEFNENGTYTATITKSAGSGLTFSQSGSYKATDDIIYAGDRIWTICDLNSYSMRLIIQNQSWARCWVYTLEKE